MTTHIPKKQNSTILDEFKKSNNPLYQSHFGIALNSIIHWTKDFNNNYIVVTMTSGDRFMYAGSTAKTILYSIGDKDNTRFTPMTHEEEQLHIESILNPRPKSVEMPVEMPTQPVTELLAEPVEEAVEATPIAASVTEQSEVQPSNEQPEPNTFRPAAFGY